MKPSKTVIRNAHFLGTKIRNLRKSNNLTMEDLSARCVKIDPEAAPSVSYLSMIERGKRVPSAETLHLIAQVFQKGQDWFLDNSSDEKAIIPNKIHKGGMQGISLEPGFLFERENLQIAIPELLTQAGVSGREFAQILIRSHQERQQNRFPDLERAAEGIGKKQMPLGVDDLTTICKRMGIAIKWFKQQPSEMLAASGYPQNTFIRSYFEPPGTIYVHQLLKRQPTRLKYDLAAHIGHMVLHASDEVNSMLFASREGWAQPNDDHETHHSGSTAVNAQEILQAWRDFEVSFFAGALLCPKVPFRRLLEQHAHEFQVAHLIDVTVAVAMRRMTAVSSYPHWHYFDAYPPGKLNAVYRGNGIPLPWGNMRLVQDPCKHWAVFSMLGTRSTKSSAQISILEKGNAKHIYACESIRVKDFGDKPHVLCAGIDISPALDAQGYDAGAIGEEISEACVSNSGTMAIPEQPRKALNAVAKILNIAWLERGIEKEAQLICPRSNQCPRAPKCPT